MMHDMLKREDIEISVIMATYNPSWEKCVFTLDSILGQKGICFELIVADDGSKDNLFERFNSYLKEKGFSDYKLIPHEKNQGTVRNFYDAISIAKGEYIKLISPGDALFNDTTLEKWLLELKSSGKRWSFGEAVYYQYDEDKPVVIQGPAFPRIIDCYTLKDELRCRWNYVVLEDVALGAALLCEKKPFLYYLKDFLGISKYAEDVVLNAMMYDGYLPYYYNSNVVFYEYGIGVSTGDKKWKSLIQTDLRNAELVISNYKPQDKYQSQISKVLKQMNSGGPRKKRFIKNIQKGGINKIIKYRLNPRLSSMDCSLCGPWWEKYK